MKTLTLYRFSCTNECAVGDILNESGDIIMHTLENPWLDNEPYISCIPDGEYTCIPHTSPNHGPCYAVQDVEGRRNILIHVGNYTDDTDGCILVGKEHGELGGEVAILQSRTALGILMDQYPLGFLLDIVSFGNEQGT